MKVMEFQENNDSNGNMPQIRRNTMLECEDNGIVYLWWKAA